MTTSNLATVQHSMDKAANKLLKRVALHFEANHGVKVSEDEPQRGKLNAVLVEYVALRGAGVKLTLIRQLPGRAQWPVQVESQLVACITAYASATDVAYHEKKMDALSLLMGASKADLLIAGAP